MTENSRSNKKKNLFAREAKVLTDSKAFLDKENLTLEECINHIKEVNFHYEELVDQSKLITKVSDRLQKKINRVNDQLEGKNAELQETLDDLTKAKVGRKAATIVLIIFMVIFIVVEAFVEPHIDDWADSNFHDDFDDNGILILTVGIKGVLALLLRPLESLVEKILLRRAKKEAEKNRQTSRSKDYTNTDSTITF